MGIVLSWLTINWFSLLQTIGIVSGLFFTGYSLVISSRLRRFDTLVTITDQHRALWLKFHDTPAFRRIISPKPELEKHPITDDERLFVNLVILNLTTVLTGVRKGVFPKPAGMDVDIKEFFSLPIPRAAWEKTKKYRDTDMIRYVEGLLIV